MSWLPASLMVLAVALALGFGWYERSHPSARVLALVATLAALAALGRIAFAPLPNVKPTTDIVLIAGYALGGAPGFAVGSVAALTSNVFFGQQRPALAAEDPRGLRGEVPPAAEHLGGRRVGHRAAVAEQDRAIRPGGGELGVVRGDEHGGAVRRELAQPRRQARAVAASWAECRWRSRARWRASSSGW